MFKIKYDGVKNIAEQGLEKEILNSIGLFRLMSISSKLSMRFKLRKL
jgi:hypothetical protein